MTEGENISIDNLIRFMIYKNGRLIKVVSRDVRRYATDMTNA